MLFLIIVFTVLIVASIVCKIIAKKNEDYQTMFRRIHIGINAFMIVGLIIILVFSSFYSVSENQQAVVTMFGQVVRTDTAGVHWKVPVLQRVRKVDITTHGASIGYAIDGSTQTLGSKENPQMITSDFNLIDVDFYMEYRINDPVAYLYNSEDPELVLTNIAMSHIRAIVSDYKVDDVMTTAKGEIQAKIKENLSGELSRRNIGLQLVNIMIQDVEPPTAEVFNAFKSVESAKQQADTALNNANRYKNEKIPEAEANADRIIQSAEAAKATRIAEAEGQTERFNKMYEEYKKYPLITKKRLFYEMMEELLPDLNVIITDGETETMLPLAPFVSEESQTQEEGGNES